MNANDDSQNSIPSSQLDEAPLPPVEPPSAGFLLQLFVIPMVIVTIIVMVWLMLNWLAHMGTNPQKLVQDLRRLNDSSWQKALTLAELLRNPDYDYLKQDAQMAEELGDILDSQLELGASDEGPVRLRMFLCRALGEFRVPNALPPLIKAATAENDPKDIDVRRTALEALAIYSMNNDARSLQSDEQLMRVLRDASRERSENQTERMSRAELRSTAAYVLGVLGGEEALARLELMLADAHSNARYNAALGLARHGDIRARSVLLEMLNPDNQASAEDETHESEKASKRLLVIKNGIRGAAELAENNDNADLAQIREALEVIVDSDLPLFDARVRRGIHINARDALITVRTHEAEHASL